MELPEKRVEWMGSSRRDLAQFPSEVRRLAGFNIGRVQAGLMPEDFKPMVTIGPGAYEIRVAAGDGGKAQYRVVYVAKFAEAVYVLHAFEKRTPRTSGHDVDVARARYQQMLRRREQENIGRRTA
ncbi:MAG TPA: type II toxin-antitoxin system RelE/ParE family toxin [Longimicrobium sp.]|nr:type II toxin-antitoxin system RelE/ParE family toxin [Longimicrobium sp.]